MESSYFNNIVNSEYGRKNDEHIEYGTAGFRTKSDILEHVLYRMGLLAVLRSKAKKAAIGLMITASHNLEPDNGIKLVDPAGEMLEASWETIATNLANVVDGDLISMLTHISTKENIDLSIPATVIIGRDTRKSSPILLKAALAGIKALNGNVTDLELVTTPQLHYVVVCTNTDGAYGDPTLKVPVACVSTGVKHLHKKALEFDIGVYFEANGHGTVIFKDTAKEAIKNHAKNKMLSSTQRMASSKLRDVIDLINETVGDALSDMLLVETILHAKGWDVVEWERSYNDLPNKQLKVRVKDRNLITTTNAGRNCLTPVCLQEEIDKIVSKYPRGRSFVRPSGTEDIVRVYAECECSLDVNKLAVKVASLVYRLAGGVGPEPSLL
ncbi:Phosphoacetylglucosamine mutase [Cyphomyrmex costatus]|uniref:phosphoacetylglucosamine mutase n=1 Tax=Cyphomyrmex costatus TaxID=456900 RepID=A0A195CFN1_9HYME|nr:Phosphoacetylglucosamine mutase [Cyphomyrmex costatus]